MSLHPDLATAGSPGDWLNHAESDLRIARLARQDAEVLPNQIAFHAQQATEKALKGVLVGGGVEFPKTHHLEELIALVQETGISWPFPVDQVEALTPYAVQTRYPGGISQISRAKVDEAIGVAEQVLAWAKDEVAKVSGAGA
jgi:HEPN domain-containing protein